MPLTLHIGPAAMRRLVLHAQRAYPEECCGLLVGPVNGKDARVERAIEADNITEGDRRRTYQIDWRMLLDTMSLVRQGSLRLVGFYHTHTDGSTEPSNHDRREAWIDHSYLIVAMKDGRWTNLTSWRVPDEQAPFQRECVALV